MENTIDSMLSYTPVYDEEITKSFENNFSRIKGKWQANCTIFTFSVFTDMTPYGIQKDNSHAIICIRR